MVWARSLTSASVALALISVIAVAAVAAALLSLRARSRLQADLDASRAEVDRLGEALRGAQAERDDLRGQTDHLTAVTERLTADAERERQRADELAVLLEAATAEVEQRSRDGGGDGEAAAGLWHLLLTHVTRRWAAVVGVPPDRRSLAPGTPVDQLAEALARETERLREEVGVDVELKATPTTTPGDGDAAGDVAVLVAALELLGALATSAQRITVEIGEALVLTGDGWADPYGELPAAHAAATAAGVAIDPMETGDEWVRLVVRHTA